MSINIKSANFWTILIGIVGLCLTIYYQPNQPKIVYSQNYTNLEDSVLLDISIENIGYKVADKIVFDFTSKGKIISVDCNVPDSIFTYKIVNSHIIGNICNLFNDYPVDINIYTTTADNTLKITPSYGQAQDREELENRKWLSCTGIIIVIIVLRIILFQIKRKQLFKVSGSVKILKKQIKTLYKIKIYK